MARRMTKDDIHAFIDEAPRTGHLATVREDGRPHVAPLWIVRDGDDIIFSTSKDSVKGQDLIRTGQAALTVDDPTGGFSFVVIEGTVQITEDLDELQRWATALAAKYMGPERAEAIGKRNAVEGELLVRLTPTHMTGERGVTT